MSQPHRQLLARRAHWRHGAAARVTSGVIAMALTLLVAPATPSRAADSDETVRLGIAGEALGGQNPFTDFSWYPQVLVYEQLVGMGLQGEVVAGFAESWTTSPDGRTWTFKIHAGRQWSDGTPATAKDVAFTFNYLLDSAGTPNELNLGANSVSGMQGIVEFVEAPTDDTVVFTLSHPSTYPLSSGIWIVPEHVWGKVSHADVLTTFKNDSPTVGTGPFVSTEFKVNEFVQLTPNPYYAGDGPMAKAMTITQFTSPDTAVQALLQGEIDALETPPVAALDQLDADPNVVAKSSGSPWYFNLTFNNSGKAGGAATDAVTDAAFRDALGYALDRQALVDKAMLGHATVSHSPVSPLLAASRSQIESDLEPIKRSFDIGEANRRLDAAGYVDSDGDGIREDHDGRPLELKLIFTTAFHVSLAQFVTDWLAQVGVSVVPNGLDTGAFLEHFESAVGGGPGWDLAVAGSWAESELAKSFETWTTERIGGTNRAWFSNAEYDALVEKLRATVDPDERAVIASELATLLYVEAPLHVLLHVDIPAAYRIDKWEGWTDQPAEGGRPVNTYWPELTWQNLRLIGSDASAAPSADAATTAPSAAATEAPAGGSGTTGSDSTPLIAGAVVVLLVVAGGIVAARRRRAA